MMRREKLEHLMAAGIVQGKHSWEKQHEKKLDGQKKWLKVGRMTEALKVKAVRDRDARKVMIPYAKEHST